MQTTLLHLDEVGEQAREHHATLAAERLQTVEQLHVGEIAEVMRTFYTANFRGRGRPVDAPPREKTLPPI
jgi:hypothetical protein